MTDAVSTVAGGSAPPPIPTPTDGDSGETTPPAPACSDDNECNDGDYCNGAERCARGDDDGDAGVAPRCISGLPPCSKSACNAMTRTCDCDLDGDGRVARRCGGPDEDDDGDGFSISDPDPKMRDCDDTNPQINPHAHEQCDPEGVDEDCNPETVAAPRELDLHPGRDRDHDGYINVLCTNTRADGTTVRGNDCDDGNAQIHPNVKPFDDVPFPGPVMEVCDQQDNDCDGLVDRVRVFPDVGVDVAVGSDGMIERTLLAQYCLDKDNDGYSANVASEMVRACRLPSGYVPCRLGPEDPVDCNDAEDPTRHGRDMSPAKQEVCDLLDNDCNGVVDDRLPGGLLPGERPYDATKIECTAGKLAITGCPAGRAWCNTSTVNDGCETDIARLMQCAGCATTNCHFACGQTGCEELVTISVGADFGCGVTDAGRVSCWGRGAEGRLGDDRNRGSTVPTTVIGVENVFAVSTGGAHACAVAGPNKQVYCWGSNAAGQLATAEASGQSPVALPVSGGLVGAWLVGVRQLSAGAEHTCAVLDGGRAVCWGRADAGRLGSPGMTESSAPPQLVARMEDSPFGPLITPIERVRAVSVGAAHACFVDEDGSVACWGSNASGQLGTDKQTETMRESPAPVAGLPAGAEQVAAGGDHSCALVHGVVYCWGHNAQGQLGREGLDDSSAPSPVEGLPPIASIAAGLSSTCARTADGQAYCWGRLLDVPESAEPNFDAHPRKLDVAGVHQLELGLFGCVLLDDHVVHCWGDNTYGELGTGSTSTFPQNIGDAVAPHIDSHP